MSTVHKYRVYCTTDSKYEFTWGETEPTTCPTNTGHTINTSLTTIVDTLKENLVTVNENKEGLGGSYKMKGYVIKIPASHVVAGSITSNVSQGDSVIDVDQATIDGVGIDHYVQLNDGTTSSMIGKVIVIDNTNNQITVSGTSESAFTSGASVENITTIADFTQKKDVGVLSYNYVSSEDNNGDGLEVHVYPDTIVGALTANVSTGDTVLNVTSTVTDNMAVGFFCRLYNGLVKECMGEVLGVDKTAGQITVEKGALNNFSAVSPTYIMLTVKMAEVEDFGPAGPRNDGNDKIGSSKITANKPIHVLYNNLTGGAKKFAFRVGHLY